MTTTFTTDQLTAIERLCRAYGVLRLDVFGSAVRDDFDQTHSDYDFLVEFTTDAGRNRSRDYFDLRDELAGLLDRPVDLVMARAVRNRYLQAAIDAERRMVYAA